LKGLATVTKKTPYQLDAKRVEEQKTKAKKELPRASERIQAEARKLPPSAAPDDASENKLGAPALSAAPVPSVSPSVQAARDTNKTPDAATTPKAPTKAAPAAPTPAAPPAAAETLAAPAATPAAP
jgi:hypothetical protein